MDVLSFETLLTSVIRMYNILLTSANFIFMWFADPIDGDIAEILGLSLNTTNLELVLGVAIPVVLVLTVYGFIRKAFIG